MEISKMLKIDHTIEDVKEWINYIIEKTREEQKEIILWIIHSDYLHLVEWDRISWHRNEIRAYVFWDDEKNNINIK
jgi:hypothetical protein